MMKTLSITTLTLIFSTTRAFLTSSLRPSAFVGGKTELSLLGEGGVPDGEKRRRMPEFVNLEPLEESSAREQRMKRERRNRVQFSKYGDELWELRSHMAALSEELVAAMNEGEPSVEESIRDTLRKVEERDPELTYKIELSEMHKATAEGREADAQEHKAKALNARSCLPHFNLQGLWVGKYGHHGYEMINVTYAGDIMIAYKVTGDKNVPRGEITFQADLSPLAVADAADVEEQELQPIKLTDQAAKKWGTSQLPRYHGLGQVSEEGHQNSQWLDGQLIVIGQEYFSFAWVPIEYQIFFGRPSPELALKMLRNGGGTRLKGKTWEDPPNVEDDVGVLKDYAAHCFELTAETIEEDFEGDEFGCIWHGMDTEECYFE